MSINKNTYVVYGYDLSSQYDEIMTEELRESNRYEEMTYKQRAGEVQCFDDPMCGNHLYVGFVLGKMDDDYSDKCVQVNPDVTGTIKETVDSQLSAWGIQTEGAPFELMVFNEFT